MSVLIKSTRWCSQLLRLEAAVFAAAAATALAEMALAVAERRAADLQGGFSSRAAATYRLQCSSLLRILTTHSYSHVALHSSSALY